jgi:Holliday junction DNA helicase RuvB
LQGDAAAEIARRSRDTPRIANNRLRWVRDYADSQSDGNVTLEVARAALAMAEIDVLGLDKQDRKYLETIIRVFGGGPAGVEAIAHTLNLETDTLADEVEPYLLRSELVVRTPRGRVVTARAYEHLQLPPPADSDNPQPRLF